MLLQSFKSWGICSFQFCILGFIEIHCNQKQKDFLKSLKGSYRLDILVLMVIPCHKSIPQPYWHWFKLAAYQRYQKNKWTNKFLLWIPVKPGRQNLEIFHDSIQLCKVTLQCALKNFWSNFISAPIQSWENTYQGQ